MSIPDELIHHDVYSWDREPEPEDMGADLVLLLETLTDKQRFVIDRRYGLNGRGTMTQHEIANALGISQPSVVRLENRALARMQRERGINGT